MSALAPTAPRREPAAAETGKEGRGGEGRGEDMIESHWCRTRVRKEIGLTPPEVTY